MIDFSASLELPGVATVTALIWTSVNQSGAHTLRVSRLRSDGGLYGGGVGGVDLEGLGDAVHGDVDGVFVFGGEGAVGGGCV